MTLECRFCKSKELRRVLDLGFAPPSNSFLSPDNAPMRPETYYPLRITFCSDCSLVQTEDFLDKASLFTDEYPYFSSTSNSWLSHAKNFSLFAIDKLGLTKDSFVVEIASNDGYLLRNFIDADIPCLGIEPTESTAKFARSLGIEVVERFFGERLAHNIKLKYQPADLIIGNNVYAHVPDILDFTRGLKRLLNTDGTVVLEFPHLLRLVDSNQFDTVYHEHFSYLSLSIVDSIFNHAGMRIYQCETLETHGGSLRVYGCHQNASFVTQPGVIELLEEEKAFGLVDGSAFRNLQHSADRVALELMKFLIHAKESNKKVIGYGAAAKGNTLLNYARVDSRFIHSVVDSSPGKIGKLLPGSHIPIISKSSLDKLSPDYVIIFPWNIKDEIIREIDENCLGQPKKIVFIPSLEIF